MQQGTVRQFNNEKGYGFIRPDAGGPDVFVHYTAIQGRGFRTLDAGQRVEFEMIDNFKGPKAENVYVLGGAE